MRTNRSHTIGISLVKRIAVHLVAAFLVAAVSISPALAKHDQDDNDDHHDKHHKHREHHKHGDEYEHVYSPPPVVYEPAPGTYAPPPPVVYAAPVPTINIVIPIH